MRFSDQEAVETLLAGNEALNQPDPPDPVREVLMAHGADLRRAFILYSVPEQEGEFVKVLVDEDRIADVLIPYDHFPDLCPTVEWESVSEYYQRLRDFNAKSGIHLLRTALRLVID